MGCSKSSSKREVCSNTTLPQETRKTSNRQPNITPKTTGKRKTTTKKHTPKISRRKEITKIQAEINEKEMKVKVKSLSHVRLFVTPWTVVYQSPQSMEFSRQEYWSGLPFPSPGDLPNPGTEPRSPTGLNVITCKVVVQ